MMARNFFPCMALTAWLLGAAVPAFAQKGNADDEVPLENDPGAGTPPGVIPATASEPDPGLTCKDCLQQKRSNPFLGGEVSLGLEILVFSVVFIFAYLLAIAFFKKRVESGGGIVSSCVVAMSVVLVVALIGSWVCFCDRTWKSCWCEGMRLKEDGKLAAMPISKSLEQVNWLYWGIAAVVTVLLVLVIKLVIGKPAPAAARP